MWSTLSALEEQILDAPAPRTAGQAKETVGEGFSQNRVQQRLVKQVIEVRKGPVEQFFELLQPQMVEQFVEVPKIVVGLAISSGEAGSVRLGENVTAVARPAGGARHIGIAKQSAKIESNVAVSSGEAGPSWSRAKGTTSADVAAVA